MARRRKSRAFGLSSAQHARAGAKSGMIFRASRSQALRLAKAGNCPAAIHELAEAARYEGQMTAHGRSRSVEKRAGTRYRGRLYTLTKHILTICHVTAKR